MMEWMKIIQMNNLKNETRFRDLLLHGKKGALFSTLIRLTNTYGIKQADGSYNHRSCFDQSRISKLLCNK